MPVEQALGLTSAELAERLGVKPAEQRRVTSAELKDGALVETMPAGAIVGAAPCPANGFLTIRLREGPARPLTQSEPPAVSDWVFVNGRYVFRAGSDDRQPGVGGRPATSFVSACVEVRSKGGPDPAAVAALPATLPYAAVVGTAQQLPSGQGDRDLVAHDINATLRTLALGEPPPGGLSIWLANLPPPVTLMRNEGDMVQVSVNGITPSARADASTVRIHRDNLSITGDVVVTFSKGVVSKLERGSRVSNRYICDLTPARTFHCGERPPGRRSFIDLVM